MDKIPTPLVEVCNYCSYLVWNHLKIYHRTGCSLRKNEKGQFINIMGLRQKDNDKYNAIGAEDGCNKFEPSGLPAHPIVLERMIEFNPLCKNIPSDPESTLDPCIFIKKIEEYIPKKNIVTPSKIQYPYSTMDEELFDKLRIVLNSDEERYTNSVYQSTIHAVSERLEHTGSIIPALHVDRVIAAYEVALNHFLSKESTKEKALAALKRIMEFNSRHDYLSELLKDRELEREQSKE